MHPYTYQLLQVLAVDIDNSPPLKGLFVSPDRLVRRVVAVLVVAWCRRLDGWTQPVCTDGDGRKIIVG